MNETGEEEKKNVGLLYSSATYLVFTFRSFLVILAAIISRTLIYIWDKTRNPRNKALKFTARR
jgi:hypothetical protein